MKVNDYYCVIDGTNKFIFPIETISKSLYQSNEEEIKKLLCIPIICLNIIRIWKNHVEYINMTLGDMISSIETIKIHQKITNNEVFNCDIELIRKIFKYIENINFKDDIDIILHDIISHYIISDKPYKSIVKFGDYKFDGGIAAFADHIDETFDIKGHYITIHAYDNKNTNIHFWIGYYDKIDEVKFRLICDAKYDIIYNNTEN